MSSYVDVNQRHRRARYYAPPVSPRRRRRIKLGWMVVVGSAMLLGLTQVVYGGGRTGTEQVTVQPGQSLWAIASSRYPEDDPRSRVADIVRLNQLGSQPVYAGEKLTVPAR